MRYADLVALAAASNVEGKPTRERAPKVQYSFTNREWNRRKKRMRIAKQSRRRNRK